jgi:drug/metabolite transporter (DMT)-like permease
VKRGYIYILLAAVAFSSMEAVGKTIASQINPFQLNFLRFGIGGLIMLPFALREAKARGLRLTLDDFGYLTLIGFLGVCFSMSLFQMAILYAKASEVAVIFSTNPVFTIPLAYLLLKEELPPRTGIALGLSLVGLVFFLNPFSGVKSSAAGIWMAIGAALSFAFYGVLSKKRIARYGSLILNCCTFLIGDVMLLVFLKLRGLPVFGGVTPQNIIQVLYMGIFVTGLGYLFYFMAMKETSVTTASLVFFIKPALAPVFTWIIVGEALKLNMIWGIAFVLAGSYALLSGRLQAQRMAVRES